MHRSWTLLGLLTASAALLQANPTGGEVTAGSASIAGQGSPTVTINQASQAAIINWNTFSIGSGELTKFIQPSATSAALNRVLGGQTSFINGTLSANGQVFLINGNGIVIGAGGIITAAGFTGSTRDIADGDFLSGKLHFTGSGDAGVRNLGTIDALGGDVVLIGKTVENKGAINATGTVGLIAGDDVLLAQQNDDGSTITVNPVGAPSAARGKVGVKNSGTITASTAELKAANGNIYALAIQNEGIVRATTVTRQGGHIYLTADSGTVINSGTLDASATAAQGHGGTILMKSAAGKVAQNGKLIAKGGAGGTGGSADVSGAQMEFTGTVDFTAPGGATGDLLLDPATLQIVTGGGSSTAASTIDPLTIEGILGTNGTGGANLILSAESNITVTNGVTWDSPHTLTLETTDPGGAQSTLVINSNLTDTDPTAGGLTIAMGAPGDLITTSEQGTISVANFNLMQGAWVQLISDGSNFNSSLPGNLFAAPPQMPGGTSTPAFLPGFVATNNFEIGVNATFLRADGGNGADTSYGLEDIYGLQGMKGFLSTNFTLNGNTINGTVFDGNGNVVYSTATWNSGAGFAPIGPSGTPYTGNLSNGTVSGVTINLPDSADVGLIAVLGSNGTVENVSVEDMNVTGHDVVGGLVGDNFGYIFGSSNFGNIYGNGSTNVITGYSDVGGLVGSNEANATVSGGISYATVAELEGGFHGANSFGTGGAVGLNEGSVSSVQSAASVTGDMNIGGVAGENDGTISGSNTFPVASVTGTSDVGGIAGLNTGTISGSYNSGSVTEMSNEGGFHGAFGGIAGKNEVLAGTDNNDNSFSTPGLIETSYNTGTVDGSSGVGGIVGLNYPGALVTTVYNLGSVGDSDTMNAGGIVGDNSGTVTYAYNSGAISGAEGFTGALVGFDENGAATSNSYYDSDTSVVGTPTNSNFVFVPTDPEDPEGPGAEVNQANESNLATVTSSSGSTAYTIQGNGTLLDDDTLAPAGYGFFGTAALVPHTNGVYAITAPDQEAPSWYIIDGYTRPLLASEYSTTIINPHQLQLMAVDLGASYSLGQNLPNNTIDMSVETAGSSEIWNTQGFVPIGTAPSSSEDPAQSSYSFTGNFNGNGTNIGQLSINLPGSDNESPYAYVSGQDIGLFGYVDTGGSVSNVTLVAPSIIGYDEVGAVVGENHGTVSSVSLNTLDENSGSVTGSDVVGGLVGDNYGTIQYSYNFGTPVSGTDETIGGIAGSNEQGATLNIGFNEGTVTGVGILGGVAGYNDGTIIDYGNYNTVSVAQPQIDSSIEATPEVEGGQNTGADNIGGIVGWNDVDGQISEAQNYGSVQGLSGITDVGGLVGYNAGTVSQSYNEGSVGTGVEENVGGLIGENNGQLDDSYNGTGDPQYIGSEGAVSGDSNVGGLVGYNDAPVVVNTDESLVFGPHTDSEISGPAASPGGTIETSYSTANVSGNSNVGALVGENDGAMLHVYWDTDTYEGDGIGTNTGSTTDVIGLPTSTSDGSPSLSDYRTFVARGAVGTAPTQWDFTPETNGVYGVWGVNVYGPNGPDNQAGLVNGGLPVLQWQDPVIAQIVATNGTEPYGYTPSYTATGDGASPSNLQSILPNLTVYSPDPNGAGDTQQLTFLQATPTLYNNVEYVNGTVNVVQDQLDITANSYTVAPGSPTPVLGATYTGFQPGHDSSDLLGGPLVYTVTPLPETTPGLHTISASGQYSAVSDQDIPNYNITYFTGVLNVANPTPSQIAATFTAEIASLQNQFGHDPYNGLDPLYFMIIPNQFALGGDLFGAINNEPDATDYAYASSTSTLPAFSRLVTPGTGVVEIIGGVVVIGNPQTGLPVFLNTPGHPLSDTALTGLRGVLAPSVYDELLALIHGP